MKICVAGLGLIGGSMCMALKRAGYEVYGYNRSKAPLNFAITNGVIDGVAQEFSRYDVVFVAMPLNATIDFINNNSFKNGAVISDICGVKRQIEQAVNAKPRNFFYVGSHPMAGKEVSTIYNATADLFKNASMVLTYCAATSKNAFSLMRVLARDMGFKYIVECTAEEHDKKIAYTSQLPHVISNSYVKDGEASGALRFTGGSFQDMSRVGGVSERVWSELYLANADNLSQRIDCIIRNLQALNQAISAGDKAALEKLLRQGRESLENCKTAQQSPDITVTQLHS